MLQEARSVVLSSPFIPLTISPDSMPLPLCGESVQAGFPSPADDWLEDTIDLNQKLVRNPAATILMRVAGDSMRDAGILQGDVVVVDGIEPRYV